MASHVHTNAYSRHTTQRSCWCVCILGLAFTTLLQVASGSGVLPQQDGSTAQQLYDAEASTAAAHQSLAAQQQQQQQQQQAVELPGQPDPIAEALTSYLVSLGAEANVAVRRLPGFGRATVAPRDIQKGEVLARVPLQLTYHTNGPLEGVAHKLLTNMRKQQHILAPYFKALPGPSEIVNSITLPKAYLSILQDSSTELSVQNSQALAFEEWQRHSPEYWTSLGPNMSCTNLTYAMAVISTRRYGIGGGSRLIPVMDLANHQPGCKHSLQLDQCTITPALRQWPYTVPADTVHTAAAAAAATEPASGSTPTCSGGQCGLAAAATAAATTASGSGSSSSSSIDRCIVWRAGEAVSAGQQVCYGYRSLMLQDYALLQYGFLQEGPIASELSLMDRPERSPSTLEIEKVMGKIKPSSSGLPKKFTGTTQELQQEVQRLDGRLQLLKAGDAHIAAVAVDAAGDPDGRMLALLLKWRQQRLNAIETEVDRLKSLMKLPGESHEGKAGLLTGAAVAAS